MIISTDSGWKSNCSCSLSICSWQCDPIFFAAIWWNLASLKFSFFSQIQLDKFTMVSHLLIMTVFAVCGIHFYWLCRFWLLFDESLIFFEFFAKWFANQLFRIIIIPIMVLNQCVCISIRFCSSSIGTSLLTYTCWSAVVIRGYYLHSYGFPSIHHSLQFRGNKIPVYFVVPNNLFCPPTHCSWRVLLPALLRFSSRDVTTAFIHLSALQIALACTRIPCNMDWIFVDSSLDCLQWPSNFQLMKSRF